MTIEIYRSVNMSKPTLASSSKNLRGVIEYARKHGVNIVSVYARGPWSADMFITFGDDAYCQVDFASLTVANQFVRRRRSWGKPTITDGGANCATYYTY